MALRPVQNPQVQNIRRKMVRRSRVHQAAGTRRKDKKVSSAARCKCSFYILIMQLKLGTDDG